MRIAATLALIVLLPLAAWGQSQPASATVHFEDWPASTHWASDKQSFDVKMGVRRADATFTVATNGFGWHWSFTGGNETFNRWADVTAWCWAPGTVSFRIQRNRPMAVYSLEPEVLAAIVDGHFNKFAAEVEWSGDNWACTPLGTQWAASCPNVQSARIARGRRLRRALKDRDSAVSSLRDD
jgi:hypothetical protein